MLGFLCHLNLFPHFLDHELGKKILIICLGRYDIFIVYVNGNRQVRAQLLPFMLKYENSTYVHGQP